jgi:nucleoside-diphosphate-sugar epimerase
MNILVVGATGMTGRSLVEQLLGKNYKVRIIVRSSHKLPAVIVENPNTTTIEASVLDLTDEEVTEHVKDCDAVVSCLGHVMDFKGIFGEPKKLCTDATRNLCNSLEKHSLPKPTKFILMNTVGVQNPDLEEKRNWFERGLLILLHLTLTPHRDSETAAEYLHKTLGKENKSIEWCCVRPDSLINAEVSPYDITESPTTGIINGRPTARDLMSLTL